MAAWMQPESHVSWWCFRRRVLPLAPPCFPTRSTIWAFVLTVRSFVTQAHTQTHAVGCCVIAVGQVSPEERCKNGSVFHTKKQPWSSQRKMLGCCVIKKMPWTTFYRLLCNFLLTNFLFSIWFYGNSCLATHFPSLLDLGFYQDSNHIIGGSPYHDRCFACSLCPSLSIRLWDKTSCIHQ